MGIRHAFGIRPLYSLFAKLGSLRVAIDLVRTLGYSQSSPQASSSSSFAEAVNGQQRLGSSGSATMKRQKAAKKHSNK